MGLHPVYCLNDFRVLVASSSPLLVVCPRSDDPGRRACHILNASWRWIIWSGERPPDELRVHIVMRVRVAVRGGHSRRSTWSITVLLAGHVVIIRSGFKPFHNLLFRNVGDCHSVPIIGQITIQAIDSS